MTGDTIAGQRIARDSLRTLTDEQLFRLYHDGHAEALTEAKRRDQVARFIRERAAERDAVRAEWYDAAFAQYLAAEAACNGYLVADGAPVGDAFELWAGPERTAWKRASEELRNFWLAHPRITVTQYAAQVTAGHRAQREEHERAGYDSVDDDAAGDVRQSEGDAGSAAAARPARSAGDTGHVRGRVVIRASGRDWGVVTVTAGGQQIGRAVRTHIRVSGALRSAWWAHRAGGSSSLHPGRDAAVAALTA
jgi:hypothetical protein